MPHADTCTNLCNLVSSKVCIRMSSTFIKDGENVGMNVSIDSMYITEEEEEIIVETESLRSS
eukprot:5549001-Ditylum_brightwellii.AAC.1